MRRIQTLRAASVPILALTMAVGLSGCSPGEPRPSNSNGGDLDRAQRLFDEAEELRYRYVAADSRAAIEGFRESLDIWKSRGEPARAFQAARNMGATQIQIGDLDSAVQSYAEARRLSSALDDDTLESEVLAELGFAHAIVGDLGRAESRCQCAFGLAREEGAAAGEAAALFCLAEVDYRQGRVEQSADKLVNARLLWSSLRDRRGEARALLELGMIRYVLSELEQADACLTEAQDLWDALGDKRGRAQTLVARGHLHERSGDYQVALNLFNEAEGLVEPMGDAVWTASVLDGIHAVYVHLGQYSDALGYMIRAQELYEEAGLITEVIDAHASVGDIYLAQLDYDRALERYRLELSVSEEHGDPRLSAWALTRIGNVHQIGSFAKRADPQRALEHFRRSLELQQDLDDPRLASFTYGNQGVAYLELGQTDRALVSFTTALELSRAAGDRVAEAGTLFNLARASRASGQVVTARRYLEDSLEAAEGLRAGVYSHVLRTSFVASIQRYYELYIDLLMSEDQASGVERTDALAFEISERARARSLLDILAEGAVDFRSGAEPELVEDERRMKRALDAKAERRLRLSSGEGNVDEIKALETEIGDLTIRYDQLQAEIRSKSPRYAALIQPEPLSLEDAQDEVLDEGTIVLEYSLGEESSYLWAVEKHRHESFELPARDLIEERSLELYRMLTARNPVPGESVKEYRLRVKAAATEYWAKAADLGEILLGAVADRLEGKRIVVVSDGAMQYLPFAALPVPGSGNAPVPLVVEHEIVSSPSVTALGLLRREDRRARKSRRTVAVLADPVFAPEDPRVASRTPATGAEPVSVPGRGTSDGAGLAEAVGTFRGFERGLPRLHSTRWEAEAIVSAAPDGTAMKALDFDASRATAMGPDLGQYRILHFATHGVVDNEHPGLSGIVLSMVDEQGRPQNGFLRLDDIYNMELSADLVVLSACSSALGKPVRGEGLVGIVRGFMYAGAKGVVASLWKVEDEATSELMTRFYSEMFKEGKPPAAALRNAQLAMWRESEWRDPFYWSAFVLQGEWR